MARKLCGENRGLRWLSASLALCATPMLEKTTWASEPPDAASRWVAVFNKPAGPVPTGQMPDGPLLGNGDVGVVVAGHAGEQKFYIGKNDFWRRSDASVETVGVVGLSIPALQGARFHEEQDMAHAEVRGTFAKEHLSVETRVVGGRE